MTTVIEINGSTLTTSRQMAIAVREIMHEWPRCVVSRVTHDPNEAEQPFDSYLSIPFALLGELIVRESPGSRTHIVIVRGSKVVLSTTEEHAALIMRVVEQVNASRGRGY